jgi:transcriptional regulator with XRE-family HTH domain
MDPAAEYERIRTALGAQLRALRRRAGLSGVELAARAGVSQSKISKIETGRTTPSVEDVEQLTRLLGDPPEHAAVLIDEAKSLASQFRTWRAMQRQPPSGHQQRYRELEAAAQLVRVFQPSLVPGLLQTAEYARQAFLRGQLTDDPAALAAAVTARLDRQTALFDPSKRFDFLITESALRTRICSETAMKAQIDRIVTLASLENVTVGYIPATVELSVLPLNGFMLVDDEIVLVETMSAELTLRDTHDVELYTDAFERLSAVALDGTAAADALRALYSTPNSDSDIEQGTPHTATA